MSNSELLRSFLTNWLEPLSYLIATFALLFSIKLHKGNKIKVLCVNSLISTILMSIASATVSSRINNILIYDLKLLTTNWAFSFYFYNTLLDHRKKVIFLVSALGTIYFFLRDIMFSVTNAFDSIGYPSFSFLVLIAVFVYYRELLKNVTPEPIVLTLDFWITSSLLLYYLSSGIIYMTIYVLTPKVHNLQDAYKVTEFWAGHNIVLFLSSLCLQIGVVWIYRKK